MSITRDAENCGSVSIQLENLFSTLRDRGRARSPGIVDTDFVAIMANTQTTGAVIT